MIGSDENFDEKKIRTWEELIKECEESERKYRTIYEESPDLHRTVNLDRIIIDCNKKYTDSLGYTKKEIIGKSIFEHTAEKSMEDMKQTFEEWEHTGRIKNRKIWMKRKDNSTFPSLLSISSIKDNHGNTIATNAIIRDITEISEAEKIIQDQFEQHQILDKQKEEFFSMMSHELKTPLLLMKGYCAMLKHKTLGDLNEEQVDAVYEIDSSIQGLEQLIMDMFDAQKMDMGRMTFKKEDIDAGKLLEDTINDFSSIMIPKEIELVKTSNEKIAFVSDKNRLKQVFGNLVKNAVDFVPHLTGKIEIGAKTQNQSVLFYVKDNGIGIQKAKQEDLFKKFYQIDASVTRKHGGTGLGLSVCKGIVEGLGGKIWVESEEGKGATFFFTIPKGDELV